MSDIVSISGLSKYYGKKKALDNLDLKLESGKIVGVLGPNGSGKTTLIKILVGILRKNSGSVLIDGVVPGVHTKAVTSYLPDRNYLYEWMKIDQIFDFFEDFYTDFNRDKAYELLEFMKLDRDMKVNSLSKGMKEKLNLTVVLSREAKLYILDEPIAGVDPVARDQILDAIIKNYKEDSTMLITTHLVRDIENVFDEVVFLKDGRLELQGDAEILREEKNMQIDDIYKDIFGV